MKTRFSTRLTLVVAAIAVGVLVLFSAWLLLHRPAKAKGSRRYQICVGYRYGFIDETGKEIIPPRYRYATDFVDGLAVASTINASCLIDPDGQVVFETEQYDLVAPPDEAGRMRARRGEKHGVLNRKGKVIVPFVYEQMFEFSGDRAAVRVNNQWGVIDGQGRVVVEPRYELVLPYSNKRALVEQDGKYGYIDPTGNEVIPLEFEWAGEFSDGLANVSINGEGFYVDVDGNTVLGPFEDAGPFCDGLAGVQREGSLFEFIQKDGTTALPAQFSRARSFSGGLAVVEKIPWGGSTVNGVYDWLGVERQCTVGLIDRQGKFVVTLDVPADLRQLPRAFADVDGLVGVVTEDFWRYFDRKGNLIWEAPTGTWQQLEQVQLEDAALSRKPEDRIWAAMKTGNTARLETLLEEHPDAANVASRFSFLRGSPLQCAADLQDRASFLLLLEHGAEVNHSSHRDESVLQILAKRCSEASLELAEAAIQAGANVNAQDSLGDTALHQLATTDSLCDLELAELLLAKGARCDMPDQAGKTPLYYAVDNDHERLIRLLVEHGANPRRENNDGVSPLQLAQTRLAELSKERKEERRRRQTLVEMLREAGKEGNAQ